MNVGFLILTIVFIIVATVMILIILMQRPQGGGLAGAFGGAGGTGADTVFGGRVGDALTRITVFAFLIYLGTAIALNKVESRATASAPAPTTITDPSIPVDETGAPITGAATPVNIDLNDTGGINPLDVQIPPANTGTTPPVIGDISTPPDEDPDTTPPTTGGGSTTGDDSTTGGTGGTGGDDEDGSTP